MLTCYEDDHDAAAAVEGAGDAHRRENSAHPTDGLLTNLGVGVPHLHHRVRTYIECDRITTSAPMESADQAAQAGGRVSTTMLY